MITKGDLSYYGAGMPSNVVNPIPELGLRDGTEIGDQ